MPKFNFHLYVYADFSQNKTMINELKSLLGKEFNYPTNIHTKFEITDWGDCDIFMNYFMSDSKINDILNGRTIYLKKGKLKELIALCEEVIESCDFNLANELLPNTYKRKEARPYNNEYIRELMDIHSECKRTIKFINKLGDCLVKDTGIALVMTPDSEFCN